MKTLFALFLLTVACFAQQPFKPVDGSGNELIVASGGSRYNSTLTAITTGGTTLSSSTIKVQVIHCLNYSAGAATITIADGAANNYADAVSMATKSVMVIHYGAVGLTYTSGIVFTASANSAIKCQVEGVR